nr:hypothetical protein DGKKSRWO_DGKKSRWO_CDS_0180 [uncultured phage]CAI9752358.1 hypothetical protein CVNMHQAP_CVNMHQAP_CDS_0181 [uncultured phage]
MSNQDIINEIKKYFEEETLKKENIVNQFSNDVITAAYQKLSANLTDIIQQEEDPMVISELLQNFLNVTKMIDEKGLSRQQVLIKLFDQLTKYEQSRYF